MNKKILILSLLSALLFNVNVTATEILIPAYFYPSANPSLSYWDEIGAAASQVGVTAIMNPNSGPSATQNSDYVAALNLFRTAGGKTIGYVPTTYGARSQVAVLADVQKYKDFYQVDGIFLDEMSNLPSNLAYYQAVYAGIKIINSAFRVVGNTGVNAPESYLSAADVLVTYENATAANYNANVPDSWTKNQAANRFSSLLYNIPTKLEMLNAVVRGKKNNVGYVYVTDDVLPNPWDTLPAYWADEVKAIATTTINATSQNGEVLVGGAYIATNYEAYRWTSALGVLGLGFIGADTQSVANAVSADGNIVVGASSNGTQSQAFRWTSAGGMQSVASWLGASGLTVPAGIVLSEATGVNGNVISGNSNNGSKQWLARVDQTGSGLLTDVAAFNQSLNAIGSRAVQTVASMPSLALFGAHHRSIVDNGLALNANGLCAWATGDIARNNQASSNTNLAEIGICKDFNATRVGVGIGQAWSNQKTSATTNAKYNGQYLIAEAATVFENGLQPSIAAFYGQFDTTLKRRYDNAGNMDTSSGTPNATSKAIRLRLDWKDALQLGKLNVSPYAGYTRIETQVDAYAEQGGSFAARFNNNNLQTNYFFAGAASLLPLNVTTDLRLATELTHRDDNNMSGNSGQIVGLSHFNFAADNVKQTSVRIIADLDKRITDKSLITVGVNAATNGGDQTWGLTTSLRANF